MVSLERGGHDLQSEFFDFVKNLFLMIGKCVGSFLNKKKGGIRARALMHDFRVVVFNVFWAKIL